VIAGIVFCLFSSVFAYSGGSGTEADPYQIATVSDWQQLMNTSSDWNKSFIMTADVNLQGVALIPVGGGWPDFNGIFDGNGHIIRNADINMPHSGAVGLFGYSNGQIRNLGVVDVNISGHGTIGGLVGYNNGTIATCYATGSVNGNEDVGGLVGWNGRLGPTITDCYATATVTGSNRVGGLAGSNFDTITNCYATGVVSGVSSVGGLVGYNYGGGGINNCYSTGSVSGSSSSDSVGGLVGGNYGGTIAACYATGAVTGNSGSYSIGGLVGYNGGSISNCYSTGAVSGYDGVGGLVGYAWNSSSVISSFWDMDTSDQTTSDGGTGKTTVEMKTLSTFASAGWDFDYTDGDPADWFIQIDEYPILTWQISPADIYTDGKNNFRDFAIFAQYWMREDCAIYNYYCDWADLDFNGSVDIDDLIVLMSYWLQSGIYE